MSDVGLNSTLACCSKYFFSSSVIKLDAVTGCGYFEQQANVELSPTSDILQMDEAFVCYVAMTRAKGNVTFSYSLMGSSGDDLACCSKYFFSSSVIKLDAITGCGIVPSFIPTK
jgi:superfamily I DNA/RNA helicase